MGAETEDIHTRNTANTSVANMGTVQLLPPEDYKTQARKAAARCATTRKHSRERELHSLQTSASKKYPEMPRLPIVAPLDHRHLGRTVRVFRGASVLSCFPTHRQTVLHPTARPQAGGGLFSTRHMDVLFSPPEPSVPRIHDGSSISPLVMPSRESRILSPSSRRPLCWYLFVTHILQSGMTLLVSSEKSRSTYLRSLPRYATGGILA